MVMMMATFTYKPNLVRIDRHNIELSSNWPTKKQPKTHSSTDYNTQRRSLINPDSVINN